MSRGVVGYALVCLVATAFAGCLDDSASLSSERPIWSSGYAFAYKVEGRVVEEGHRVDGEERDDSSSEDTIGPYEYAFEVLNTTMKNGQVPVYLFAEKSERTPTMQVASGELTPKVPRLTLGAFRQRDLAGVDVSMGWKTACQLDDCRTTLEPVEFGKDPESTYLDFPLSKGKTWTHETGDEDGWRVSAEVGSPTTVELPMGPVRAVPVSFEFVPKDISAFEKEIREEGDYDAVELSIERSMKVFYAPDYQTVVRSEHHSKGHLEASGRDDEGRPTARSAREESYVEQVLMGARLVSLPERNLDQISKIVFGEIELADPTGQARRSAGYTIEVSTSESVVNAAEEPVIEFEGEIVGDAAAFQGHTAGWRLLDLYGREVASGEGLSGKHTIKEPGYYAIEIEARDAQAQVTAAASDFVVANYEAVVHAACPLVVAPVMPNCPTAAVPVRAGVNRIVVSASVAGPLPALPGGRFVLEDPEGRQWFDSSPSERIYEIEVSDFSEATITTADWGLYLDETAGVLEEVDYRILVFFGPGASMPPREESDFGVGAADLTVFPDF